jgi:hypothetical protein
VWIKSKWLNISKTASFSQRQSLKGSCCLSLFVNLFISILVNIALLSLLLRIKMKYVLDFYMPLSLPNHVLWEFWVILHRYFITACLTNGSWVFIDKYGYSKIFMNKWMNLGKIRAMGQEGNESSFGGHNLDYSKLTKVRIPWVRPGCQTQPRPCPPRALLTLSQWDLPSLHLPW